MKNLLLIALIFFVICSYGQSPQCFSYQAVLTDLENSPLIDQNVGLKISIVKGSTDGEVVYSETQATTTNINGLISIEIGRGIPVYGEFPSIDWGNGTYYIKNEVDPLGGNNYTINAASQLLSVPYALYANNVNTSNLTLNEKQGEGELMAVYTDKYIYGYYRAQNSASGYWTSQSITGTPIGGLAQELVLVFYTDQYAYGFDCNGNWKSQRMTGTPINIVGSGDPTYTNGVYLTFANSLIVIYTDQYAYGYYRAQNSASGYWTSQRLTGTPINAAAASFTVMVYTDKYAYGFDSNGNWKETRLDGTPKGIISK